MYGYINEFDFGEMEAMKYYAPPAGWSNEKKKDNIKNKVFSGEWIGAEKKDGYFSCFIKDEDGAMILKTRSRGVDGTFANKYEWVPHLHKFFESLPNGTCLLGELYLPSAPGSKNITSLLGCLKDKCIARQEKGEKLHFYAFDCLAWDGTNYCNRAISQRVEILESSVANLSVDNEVEVARYHSGNELYEILQEVLASGGEGMVITHQNAHYEPGKRSAKITLKVKQEIKETIDCVIIGANAPTREYTGKNLEEWEFYENVQTHERVRGRYFIEYINTGLYEPVTKPYFYGWAGSLKIGLYDSTKLLHFGDLSGITDEVKENWKDYVGRVVEVGGMEIFKDTGAIRHPKLLSWRTDKAPHECTIDQIK